ncbi:MAG: TerB family tellurite resistance protein [Pikeienuella sp.]
MTVTEACGAPAEALGEALLTPAVMTMMSADRFGHAERMQLDNAIAFSPILRPLIGESCARLVKKIVAEAGKREVEETMAAVREMLSPALRETSIAIAVRVAFADGVLEETEQAAVIVMSDLLGLERDQFFKIYEVLAMLQRPAEA